MTDNMNISCWSLGINVEDVKEAERILLPTITLHLDHEYPNVYDILDITCVLPLL